MKNVKAATLILYVLTILTTSSFAQVKILFDATKAQTAGNADWQIDADLFNISYPGGIPNPFGMGNEANPQRYPSPSQSNVTITTSEGYWNGALSSFAIECVKKGYQVETLPISGAITYGSTTNLQDLSKYKIFIICEPNIMFSQAEKTAILSFVENGGGLMMIGNHEGSDRNNDGKDPPTIWNDLMGDDRKFGFLYDFVTFSQTSTNVVLDPNNPIIHGDFGSVTSIKYSAGATMTLFPSSNPKVKSIIFTNSQPPGLSRTLALSSEYGLGRIFAIGDSSVPDDGTGDVNDVLYDGWIADANGNHRRLIMNATVWLANNVIAPPEVTISKSNLSCFKSNDGTASISVVGNSFPPMFLWSNGATTSSIQNLSAGTYTVTITVGTSIIEQIVITEPEAINVQYDSIFLTCNLPSFCIKPALSGGTSPYFYLWYDGSSSDSICISKGGPIVNQVTDSNGCKKEFTVFVSEDKLSPDALILGDSILNCFNPSTILFPFSTVSNVSFLWSDGNSTITDSSFLVEKEGIYVLTVKNIKTGCTQTVRKYVTSNFVNPIAGIIGHDTINCNIRTIDLMASSDNLAYMWQKSLVVVGTERILVVDKGGTYALTVKDTMNGCLNRDSITIIEDLIVPTALIDKVVAATNNLNNGSATITVINAQSIKFYIWRDQQNAIISYQKDLIDVEAGIYFCELVGLNGCVFDLTVEIEGISNTINKPSNFFSILPNPVSQYFSVDYESASEYFEIIIYSMNFQIVKRFISDEKQMFEIGSLTPGIYIVKISDGSNVGYQKMIVK